MVKLSSNTSPLISIVGCVIIVTVFACMLLKEIYVIHEMSLCVASVTVQQVITIELPSVS